MLAIIHFFALELLWTQLWDERIEDDKDFIDVVSQAPDLIGIFI